MFRCSKVLTLLLLAGLALGAQQASPLTAVAVFRVKPERAETWTAMMKKFAAAAMDKLVKDGTVLAYGIDSDILHRDGEPNFDAWFTAPDYAAYEKAINAIEAAQQKMTVTRKQMMDAADTDKHYDLLLRDEVGNQKPVKAGALPYTLISAFQIKPGKGEAFLDGFKRYMQPTLESLLADDVIYGYSLQREEIHTQPGDYRWMVVAMPDLASMDKFDAAMRAASQRMTPEQRTEAQQGFRDATVEGSHRDSLMKAVLFRGK
jgi:hypothetical protein